MNTRIRHRRRSAGARVAALASLLFAAALPESPLRAAEPGSDAWTASLSAGALFQEIPSLHYAAGNAMP